MWALIGQAAALATAAQPMTDFTHLYPSQFWTRQEQGRTVLWADADLRLGADEIVPSWSFEGPPGAGARIRLAPYANGKPGPFFQLGTWSLTGERTSQGAQRRAEGRVATDILMLAKPARKIRVEVELTPDKQGRLPQLKMFALSATAPDWKPLPDEPFKEAWGFEMAAPRRRQNDYPNGGVLCSPTCISMVLGYWAQRVGRPELDADVPEIQAGIHDPGWGGTGNWPFNTAFAGSREGLTSYVARLRSVRDLERWIDQEVPVAVSVSYPLLLGKPRTSQPDGHLVVLIGFTSSGDPIVNDPAQGQAGVRYVYPRQRLIQGWAASRNTVYIVHPDAWSPPEGPGPWAWK